ncbi:sodium-coupled monocarboxylate transporter 1-like [Ylistrum balloti]|uniref:sodium-coupled monocarboxylate transporter 1-like n=1 Tax=Ylistrum balloti TaxID=509963 RepID=UPI002905A009|nr:sodium-coupled monocarboxylate transporter 1-like [Ylistrum balloti]
MWGSVLAVAITAIIGTATGGMKAVVWTNVFQFLVVFTGIFSIIVQSAIEVGSVKSVFDIAYEGMRLRYPYTSPNPTVRHSYWTLIIGSTISLIYLLPTQTTIQRICSVPTQRDARKMVIISAVTTVVSFLLSCSVGIFAYSYFYKIMCDPLKSEAVDNPNQILPYLVVVLFRDMPGMAGVFVAAVFSASLNAITSLLSSLSAQTVVDIVRPLVKDISEAKATLIAKLCVPVYGVIGIGISFMTAEIEGPLSEIAYSMLSTFGGASAGMFFFAAYCPWANSKGVITGGLTGMGLVMWLALGQSFSPTRIRAQTLPPVSTDLCWNNHVNQSQLGGNITTHSSASAVFIGDRENNEGIDVLYSISYYWLIPICMLTTVIVGSVVSVLTGRPDPVDVDVRYIIPFFDHCFPCLPRAVRAFLYGGVNFEERKTWLKSLDVKEVQNEEITSNSTTNLSRQHVNNISISSNTRTTDNRLQHYNCAHGTTEQQLQHSRCSHDTTEQQLQQNRCAHDTTESNVQHDKTSQLTSEQISDNLSTRIRKQLLIDNTLKSAKRDRQNHHTDTEMEQNSDKQITCSTDL